MVVELGKNAADARVALGGVQVAVLGALDEVEAQVARVLGGGAESGHPLPDLLRVDLHGNRGPWV